jgi:hypothetical protein
MKKLKRIVSGGQTGVDRAALDIAIENKIAISGWCPKGRLAEDGEIPARYILRETPYEDVAIRTEWNVRDSEGTLILTKGKPKDGTPLTFKCAQKYQRPCLVLDLTEEVKKEEFNTWLEANNIKVLNIAGPRESFDPGRIYSEAYAYLSELLKA